MAGRVYVFNANSEATNLSVGGFPGGTIPGWGFGASMYQPQSVAVPRIKNADGRNAAQFAYGENPCQASWDSFSVRMSIIIPTNGVSIDDDLILYVCANQSTLVNTRGYVLGIFQNSPFMA